MGGADGGKAVMSAEEKERKKKEKAARKAEFERQGGPPKKAPLTKQERRQLQEAQKAAKAKEAAAAGAKSGSKPIQKAAQQQGKSRGRPSAPPAKKGIFSNMRGYDEGSKVAGLHTNFKDAQVHPAIFSLGLKYAQGTFTGSISRMLAMLSAFKEVIMDYQTPENASIARDLDRHLKPMIQFLITCRPHSVTMGNAIRRLRHEITSLSPDLDERDAKEHLCARLDEFVQTSTIVAQLTIAESMVERITNGDTILTFGRSGVIQQALLKAHEAKKEFTVIVVDGAPQHEGETLVKCLGQAGVQCQFAEISSVSYVMPTVNKVFLGAGAIFSNGAVLGRAGNALVAMMAKSCNKPVIVCAESIKFSDRVQLDSISSNERGDPERLVISPAYDVDPANDLGTWTKNPKLEVLNLTYDLTPQEYISMVITEFGMVPASSVPAILLEKAMALES
mmetsp:Transcript_1765/g.2788  ORF Transcript_1765/g.2788 Transcript_1765/m.2788 type:complete len:449 (-) Transcript_1765:117-1463(-)